MAIKLLTGIAGDDFSFSQNQVVTASGDVEARLIEKGYAEEAPKGAKVEGEIPDKSKRQLAAEEEAAKKAAEEEAAKKAVEEEAAKKAAEEAAEEEAAKKAAAAKKGQAS